MADGAPTYNDGMYTPWTTPGSQAATTPAQVEEPVASTAEVVQPTTTTPPPVVVSTTTSTTTTPSPTTTPPVTTTTTTSQTTPSAPSSSSTEDVASSQATSTSSVLSSQTPGSTSLVLSTSSNLIVLSSTTSSSSLATSSLVSSSTSAAVVARPTIAATSAVATGTSFQTVYLTPVFVLIPTAAIVAILLINPRTRRWFTMCGKGRRRNNRSNFANPSDDDADALVARRYAGSSTVGASEKEWDEKRGSGPTARGSWRGWLVSTLSQGPRSVSGTSFSGTTASPFVTVPYSNLDDPSHGRKPSEGMGGGERGWSWGGQTEEPSRATGRAGGGKDYTALTGSASGRWHNSHSTRRHRSRSQMKGAQSSAGSRQLLANIFGASGAHPTSPSMYSSAVGWEDEDRQRYEPEEEVVVDFDAYLGAARVGDDELARRYMNGGEEEYASVSTRRDDPSPYDEEAIQRYETGARLRKNDFVVELPPAPTMVHTSPTKSAIVRPAPPQYVAPPAQPIFSPDRKSTRPQPPSNPSSPTRPPLPQPPRQNSNHSSSSLPYASEPRDVFGAVGGAMPAYEGGMQQSASGYSLDGVVYADETSTEVGAGAGFAGVGLRTWDSPVEKREVVIPLITTTSAHSSPDKFSRPLPSPTNAQAAYANVPRHPAPAPIARNTSFDPVFSSGPELQPLVHPSRVRQAISTLEAKAAAASAPVPPPSPDRPRTPRRSISPRWSNQFEHPGRPVSPTLPAGNASPWGTGVGRLASGMMDRSASVDDDVSVYDDGATDVGDVAELLKSRARLSRAESTAVRR